MITFDGIEVRFGDFVALPDYQLHINEGEFFTLLGPSGCGKSTALRALAGLVQPSRGEILIQGRKVTRLPSHKRQIGMVFQSYALFPAMSVRENIAFGLRTARVSKSETEDRVEAIAREVSLGAEQMDKPVTELSGGQQQRVAIARALVLKPKILLLDEPLSNLDAQLRHQLRQQLKELQEQFGITTVYVTHDQDEALALSDRVAVMDGGRIEQVGTPRTVYTAPASEFVCNFIGDANRLSAESLDLLRRSGGAGLDPAKSSYLRVEKVRMAEPGDAVPPGATAIPGTVRSVSYHGVYSNYRVEGAGARFMSIVQEHGTPGFEQGRPVQLVIDARDVLQYEARS
ncbi:ABC transporter ATP-binding protein [Streptomyces sp. LZ34]